MRDCPVWVFALDPAVAPAALTDLSNVRLFPLEVDARIRPYLFADKVTCCARAEEMAGPGIRSLAWLNLDCLIVNPPVLFDLAPAFDAAFRPVHIANIGSPAGSPLDEFWQAVYRTVDVGDAAHTVESSVDAQTLRPYYNTHCYSIDPSKGVLRAWLECFSALVADREFQSGPCSDEIHQVFMHQAVLSALVTKMLDAARIRVLPPEYSYPVHLHPQVPSARRAQTLNSLVIPALEDFGPQPDAVNGLPVEEPLRSWLLEHWAGNQS